MKPVKDLTDVELLAERDTMASVATDHANKIANQTDRHKKLYPPIEIGQAFTQRQQEIANEITIRNIG